MPFNINNPSASSSIPELYTDPTSPKPESAWVLATGADPIPDGTPIGLLLGLTYTDNIGSVFTYQLSYKTIEGSVVRVALT